jgi:predicted component of type VI protein secretion system
VYQKSIIYLITIGDFFCILEIRQNYAAIGGLARWLCAIGLLEIKVIETGYYTNQQDKLVKKFKKTLKRYEPRLSAQYGEKICQNHQR